MLDRVMSSHDEWCRRGWCSAADGMAAILETLWAHRILVSRIEHVLRPLDLTFARYELLTVLLFVRDEGMSIGGLGDRLQVHSTSATHAVQRLKEKGLVERVRSTRDRRVACVRITPTGHQVAMKATEALNEQVFTDLGLTEVQMARLWSLLRSLRAGAGDFDVVTDRKRWTT